VNCTVDAGVNCTGAPEVVEEYCTGLPELAAGCCVYWTAPAATALYCGACITCWPLTTLLYCSGADVGVLAVVLAATGACGGGGGTKEV